jgi:hypothetical protein
MLLCSEDGAAGQEQYSISFGEIEGQKPRGSPQRGWKSNIKMDQRNAV